MLAGTASAHQLMNKVSNDKQKPQPQPANQNPNAPASGIQKKPQ